MVTECVRLKQGYITDDHGTEQDIICAPWDIYASFMHYVFPQASIDKLWDGDPDWLVAYDS